MPETPQDFLDAIRQRVVRSGGAEWIASKVDGDAIVILYRQHLIGRDEPPDLVEGARLVFADFADRVLGSGPHVIADVLTEAVLEIVEPHHLGARLDVPWAHHLTAQPEEVRWHGDAVEYALDSGQRRAEASPGRCP